MSLFDLLVNAKENRYHVKLSELWHAFAYMTFEKKSLLFDFLT